MIDQQTPYEALIFTPSAGRVEATHFTTGTMEPDEWKGAIDDLRTVLDALESGREFSFSNDAMTPERAYWLASCLAENAVAIMVYVHQLDGKIPSIPK